MLKTLLYLEIGLTPQETNFINQAITSAGGELVGMYFGDPPPIDLTLGATEVVITGGSPISLVWAFLLRLKDIRPHQTQWPKVIIQADPAEGIYDPQVGCFVEKTLDYFYQHPQYRALYDIASEHVFEDIQACFAALELERSAQFMDMIRQWTLTNGNTDYGQLTFKRLDYLPLGVPAVICSFQPYPTFDDLLLLPKDKLSSKLHLQCKSLGERTLIDNFLDKPSSVWLIEGEHELEIGIHL